MLLRVLLTVVLLAVGSMACQPAPPADPEAIVIAVNAYLRSDTAAVKSQVQVEKIDAGYARVRVIPPPNTTDAATAFLKQEGRSWRVVSLGTAFSPEDLRTLGVPESVWPGT